ncbi:MAG: hypothetical protein ACK4NS_05520 [Saprospiraceae bacterium]
MNRFKTLWIALLAAIALSATGCLNIIEEVTFKKDGSGSYKMTIDMSQVKSMMDVLKGMNTEGEGEGEDEQAGEDPAGDESMANLGAELSNVAASLRKIPGLSNIKEIQDTSVYLFGYSFDFAGQESLNKALKVINKEKYDTKTEEVFKFKGKSFERLNSGDIGAQLQKTLADAEDDEENMEMIKMFFSEMTYQQIYQFPDMVVKKSSNKLSEISNNGHTLSITLKPFDEEQQKQKAGVATQVKLK